MSRRLLAVGLSLAVALGALVGTGRVAAKPPDLPLVEKDVLTPLMTPFFVEESASSQPNSFPVAASQAVAPVMESMSLFQLRPSVRRTVASCVLFGVHPLLALAPTEDYLDLDEDDLQSAIIPAVFVPQTKDEDSPNNPIFHAAPNEGPASQSVCPYMRQQQCAPDRQIVLFADPDLSRDVLQNLKALRESQNLLQTARELGRAGRVQEALDCLKVAYNLCPGSRFEEEIQATAAELLEQSQGALGEKLSQPVTLDFTDAPLGQVFDDLSGLLGINIYVDKPALDAEEVSLDLPISIKVDDVALKSALGQILKEARLTYFIKNDVLQITTERARAVAIQPSLPQIDPAVPAALDQLLHETLKVGLAAAGESEAQEASIESAPHGALEIGLGLDGDFQMFTQFRRGGAVWHVRYNKDGWSVWASPDGGADKTPEADSGD